MNSINLVDHTTSKFLEKLNAPDILFKDPEPIITETESFQEIAKNVTITNVQDSNVNRYLRIVKPYIRRELERFKAPTDNIKVKMIFTVEFHTSNDIVDAYYNMPFQTMYTMDIFDRYYEFAKESFLKWIDDFQDRGSGFVFKQVTKTELKLSKTLSMIASSYFPYQFPEKRCVLNIRNNDQKCFLWCVIAKLIENDPNYQSSHNKPRVTNYTPYEHHFNMNDISYPMAIKDIPRFEKQNPPLSINVFALENQTDINSIYPVYLSNVQSSNPIDLLYLENNHNSHYCLIKKIEALLTDKSGNIKRLCRRCMQTFTTEQALTNHQEYCINHAYCKIKLEDNKQLSFNKPHFNTRLPVVLYADFEALSISQPQQATRKLFKQEVISYGLYIHSDYPNLIQSQYLTYTGSDCEENFVNLVTNIYKEVTFKWCHYSKQKCRLTSSEECHFQQATHCYICNNLLHPKYKIREHNHFNGKYRGASCLTCNAQEGKISKTIPVFFHNGSGYDFHFLVTELLKHEDQYNKVNVLARTSENYISMSYGSYYKKLVFLDSYRFMLKSLDGVARSMNDEDFKIVQCHFPNPAHFNLIKQKGVYPYEYMDSIGKLFDTTLPPHKEFYTTLKGENVSEEDYKRAQLVWESFNCRTFLDYHNLYLKADVLILADGFEKYRDFFLNNHNIDPCHCFSAPGLTWQCGFKYTNINLDLLSDYDMLLMIEKGIRGGFSGVLGSRYVKANNKYLKDYNPSLPSNYLLYLDANNLYGHSMAEPLPTGDFKWEDPNEIVQRWNTLTLDPGRGYIFEVDLEYDLNSKNRTRRFPLAPENKKINAEDLSPYQRNMMELEEVKVGNVTKLILDLQNKKNYVIHYRLLEYYMSLGLKVTHVHRVISFAQEAWLEKYISFNTNQRTKAKSDFEKDLWKLMNNAFYGKTLENIRGRKQVKLTSNRDNAIKLFSKPNYNDHVIFNKDLVGILMNTTSIKFNKPIYLGMCILDYSKLCMYKFYYDVIVKLYPDAEVCYMDTDSMFLNIKTDDVYKDLEQIKAYLDTSDYPKDHPLYSVKNKKVPGLFKDELNGEIISEAVFLRSKSYSFKTNSSTTKKLKGISKNVISKEITFEDYKETLFHSSTTYKKMYTLNSEKHQIFINEVRKKALSSLDDKRYIFDNGIDTLPFGSQILC